MFINISLQIFLYFYFTFIFLPSSLVLPPPISFFTSYLWYYVASGTRRNTDKFSLSFHQPAALRKINVERAQVKEAFKRKSSKSLNCMYMYIETETFVWHHRLRAKRRLKWRKRWHGIKKNYLCWINISRNP